MRTQLLLTVASLVLASGCVEPAWHQDPLYSVMPDRVEALLTNDAAPRLVIRSYFVEGREPVPSAMEWLADRLLEVTGKEEVVVAPAERVDFGPVSTENNWTARRAADAFATLSVPTEPDTVNLVAVFFDGYGYSYGSASGYQMPEFIAIFPDTFRSLIGVNLAVRVGVPDPAYDGSGDRIVLLHEAGHMLGLVNNGLPMVQDHVDRNEACLCHSSNEESIMFTGNHDLVDQIERGFEPYDSFDEDDLADIRAFQAAAD